jgi:hypothetical protein
MILLVQLVRLESALKEEMNTRVAIHMEHVLTQTPSAEEAVVLVVTEVAQISVGAHDLLAMVVLGFTLLHST